MALIISLLVAIISCIPAIACTDFCLTSTDKSIVCARSMEWGVDLNSQLHVHPRQETMVSTAPNGQSGLSWQSKYGYIGADCYRPDIIIDGMNEKGLSIGALWFPGAIYQQISPSQYKEAINVLDLTAWTLGNFATVSEVKSALDNIIVWGNQEPEIKGIPTVHFALHDAEGKNAVIEFVNGQLQFYDNANGVLTNAPSFDWHMTNLRNYLGLNPDNPKPVTIGSTTLVPPGQGAGLMGVPGDWTPPARFIRTTAMLRFARPVDDSAGAINLSEHIMNAVDIPLGNIRPDNGDINHADYTQWVLIKDLTHKTLYFRSYENMQLQALNLQQIDFNPGTKTKTMPIAIIKDTKYL